MQKFPYIAQVNFQSYNSHTLAKFNTYVGLKQGDILRLLFFNSFINNLFVLPEKIHNLKKCNTRTN